MKETKAKRNDRILTGSIDLRSVGTGHRPHQTGSGAHAHRATKRCRTRSQQKAAALTGW